MRHTRLLVPFVCSAISAVAVAQTGRTMKLTAPVVLGQTASMVLEHSPALAGHQFAMAMCSPSHPGALPITNPGVAEGVLRLDPQAYGVLGIGVLDASGVSPALLVPVPNDPMLVGASFDVQGADVDGVGLVTLTDNDLEIEVSAPPPASLNMVAIAPGAFQMGSTAGQTIELPVHGVTITRPFWMGKYEVTQAEYQALIGSNPSNFQGYLNSANRPVDQVSWNDAITFCDALNVQEAAAGRLPSGYEYRLPTEAEWEYCCRAGTTTEWSVGASVGCVDANINLSIFSFCVGLTSVVGSYPTNAFGLHDMHGNVYEWCLDSSNGFANYPAGAVSDPFQTIGLYRVNRGGAWNVFPSATRSASRNWNFPDVPGFNIGFRVVCAPALP